jgi:hypothetical protein
VPVVVAINVFSFDSQAELDLIMRLSKAGRPRWSLEYYGGEVCSFVNGFLCFAEIFDCKMPANCVILML